MTWSSCKGRIERIISRVGLRTRQLNTKIALIAIPLVVIGFVLAADLPSMLGYKVYASELGYTALSLGADIIIVYLIIEELLHRDEKEYWKTVQTRVAHLITMELATAFLRVAGLLELVHELDPAIGLDKKVAAEMKGLARNEPKLRKVVGRKLSRVRLAGFDLLSESARELGNLQARYSFRFLPPKQLELMIDLETSLKAVCADASIVARGGIFAELSSDLFFTHLEHLLTLLSKAVDDGSIDSLSLMP